MPAPITIVIPTLNAQASLAQTMASLYEGMGNGLVHQVIFADGGSEDDTPTIAQALGAELVTSPKGRGIQLRKGMDMVTTPWALIVHADTILSEGWSEIAKAHLSETRAGYGKLGFSKAGVAPKLVAGWANLRSRFFGLPYGDQSLLIPMVLYQKIGGYDPISLMEDVAIARKLRGKLMALNYNALTSARRYQKNGWVRQSAKNGWFLTRFLLGADPEKLAQSYQD